MAFAVHTTKKTTLVKSLEMYLCNKIDGVTSNKNHAIMGAFLEMLGAQSQ